MISRFRCLSGEIKVARILHFFVIAKVERGVPTAFNSYIELRSALRSAVAKAMSDRTSMSSAESRRVLFLTKIGRKMSFKPNSYFLHRIHAFEDVGLRPRHASPHSRITAYTQQ